MFSRSLYPAMRDLEDFLYGSPESAEHVFDLDESFHSIPTRRRSANGFSDSKLGRGEVWYFMVEDPDRDEVRYEVPEAIVGD